MLSCHSVRAQSSASYTLEVALDVQQHTLCSKGVIHFTNQSTRPLTELWFHLYLNAFKNNRSLFLRNPFALGRSGQTLREYGYIEVHRLQSANYGAENLWLKSSPHSPGDPDDATDISVPLPAPILPGDSVDLNIEFTSHLPPILERTGYAGSFHFAGQWFPKLAKLEPNGDFAHFAFHPNSEFYADFGNYDVQISAPSSFTLGASGKRMEEKTQKGIRTTHFVLRRAHDFAFTAWDGFQELSEKIGPVSIRLLFPPWQQANAVRSLAALRLALPYASELYGPYPYDTLTVVHPPEAGADAGGMEYPGLITTGGLWFEPYLGSRGIEAVTVHELLHQWFYGLLASNESESPFLDEGLTSYAETGVMQALFGAGSAFSGVGLDVSVAALHRANAALYAGDENIGQPARQFTGFQALGGLVYSRTATTLLTLERTWGKAKLAAALRSYTARFRFEHPTPADFISSIEQSLGVNAGQFLRTALFERGFIDLRVENIASRHKPAAQGFWTEGTAQASAHPPANEAMSKLWIGQAVVIRRGNLKLPFDVALHLENGKTERRHLDGAADSFVIDYQGASELSSVEIDPDLKIPLDQDLFNNARALAPKSPRRLLDLLLAIAQLIVLGVLP